MKTRTRVLVIGAGKRVQGAILPALWCLRDTFTINGIFGRNERSFAMFDTQYQVRPIGELSGEDIAQNDFVIVAVAPGAVPSVLSHLSRHDTRHVTLFLDTPVFPLHRVDLFRFFKRFKRVLATEDTIALPPFRLARKFIEQGDIGELRRIDLFRFGYRNHALSGIKMLAGTTRIGTIFSTRYHRGLMRKTMRLPNGVRVLMYEPRDYEIGGFQLEGSTGHIADYVPSREPCRKISYRRNGPFYLGLSLDGKAIPADELDGAYLQLEPFASQIPLLSLMNSMKIRALLDLFIAARENDPTFIYPAINALVDRLMITIADIAGFAFDICFAPTLRKAPQPHKE